MGLSLGHEVPLLWLAARAEGLDPAGEAFHLRSLARSATKEMTPVAVSAVVPQSRRQAISASKSGAASGVSMPSYRAAMIASITCRVASRTNCGYDHEPEQEALSEHENYDGQ